MPRTDDDSWDLASSVGATATMVATSRAMASRGPEPLLDDPFAEPLVRAVGLAPFVRILDGDLSLEDDPMLNRKTRTEQMAVRTRFFDDFFTGAAASGIRQAVILASGLDTRGYRLPWGDGVVVYEIDQPEVIEFKTRDPRRPRCRTDRGAADRRDRPARRLAGRVARQRFRRQPADRVERGRPAALSAGRCAGPAVRQHHRAQRRGQPARHRARPRPECLHPTNGCSRSASGGAVSVSTSTQPTCSMSATALSSPTTSPSTAGGWTRIQPKSCTPATAFQFPEQPTMAVFGEMSYVNATLKK